MTNHTRQQEADILLRHYQSRREANERHRNRPPAADGPSIIRELRELQDRINELVVRYHAGT